MLQLPADRIAFYDLDRTILRRPTFTLFLFWAAWKEAPWRLLLTPVWLMLGLGYALRFFGRDDFKPAAIKLFLGSDMSADRMERLARQFAAWRIAHDVQAGAKASIERDRAEGYRLVIATAAPEFYARALAEALNFDDIVASRHHRSADGSWSPRLDGPNCYGAEKARRADQWLKTHSQPEGRYIRAYSDHPSDAALFALADEAVLVTHSPDLRQWAEQHGWTVQDFRQTA